MNKNLTVKKPTEMNFNSFTGFRVRESFFNFDRSFDDRLRKILYRTTKDADKKNMQLYNMYYTLNKYRRLKKKRAKNSAYNKKIAPKRK